MILGTLSKRPSYLLDVGSCSVCLFYLERQHLKMRVNLLQLSSLGSCTPVQQPEITARSESQTSETYQLPQPQHFPPTECLGGGHMGGATWAWLWRVQSRGPGDDSTTRHLLHALFQCCSLTHSCPLSSVIRQLVGVWLTQTSLLDTVVNNYKPRSCPWGVYILAGDSEYAFEHAVRILAKQHIDKCKLMQCELHAGCSPRGRIWFHVCDVLKLP